MFELTVDPTADEATLIAQISACKTLKCRAAAAQARAAALLADKRWVAEGTRKVPARRRCRGLASEIALARRESAARGGRHLGFARALVQEMPFTLAALESGQLSEWRATLIVRESACLDVEGRRQLDKELCEVPAALEGKGDRQIAAEAKMIAYRLDPHAVVERAAKAETDRRVTVRPAPDCMVIVSALLPMAQGVSVYAGLKRAADCCGDGRSRGQVMADTLVERVTGRPAETPVPVEVNLVLTDEALFGAGTDPALMSGYGPVPAEVARHLIVRAAGDNASRATLRRLYRHPASSALVAMESRARAFPAGLARYIAVRDQHCRTPYCDAPIRHTDHARSHARGGKTSASNGRGSCAACNYAKEAGGWRVTGATNTKGVHDLVIVTPTGATHRSIAPRLPGTWRVSEIEANIGIELVKHAA